MMQQNPQLLSCPPRDPPRWTGPPPLARRRKGLPTNIKPIYAPRHYASLAMNGVARLQNCASYRGPRRTSLRASASKARMAGSSGRSG